jgi:hypothetical protein
MDQKIIIILIFAVLGLFLLREGITGFVAIGETCCFPPDCDEEDTCSINEIEQFSPGKLYLGVFGSLMIIILSVYLIHHFKRD